MAPRSHKSQETEPLKSRPLIGQEANPGARVAQVAKSGSTSSRLLARARRNELRLFSAVAADATGWRLMKASRASAAKRRPLVKRQAAPRGPAGRAC